MVMDQGCYDRRIGKEQKEGDAGVMYACFCLYLYACMSLSTHETNKTGVDLHCGSVFPDLVSQEANPYNRGCETRLVDVIVVVMAAAVVMTVMMVVD